VKTNVNFIKRKKMMKKILIFSVFVPGVLCCMQGRNLTPVDCCGHVRGNSGYPYDDRMELSCEQNLAISVGSCLSATLLCALCGYFWGAEQPCDTSIFYGTGYGCGIAGIMHVCKVGDHHSCLCGRLKNHNFEKTLEQRNAPTDWVEQLPPPLPPMENSLQEKLACVERDRKYVSRNFVLNSAVLNLLYSPLYATVYARHNGFEWMCARLPAYQSLMMTSEKKDV
jgi:hypothetical protein